MIEGWAAYFTQRGTTFLTEQLALGNCDNSNYDNSNCANSSGLLGNKVGMMSLEQ